MQDLEKAINTIAKSSVSTNDLTLAIDNKRNSLNSEFLKNFMRSLSYFSENNTKVISKKQQLMLEVLLADHFNLKERSIQILLEIKHLTEMEKV